MIEYVDICGNHAKKDTIGVRQNAIRINLSEVSFCEPLPASIIF